MSTTRPLFTDLPLDQEEREAIEWVARMGLFEGHDDGSLRPNDPITRGQAAILEKRRAENLHAIIGYATTGLRDRAMGAVIVHPDGWVITNHHVVERYMDRQLGDQARRGQLIAEWGHGPMLAHNFIGLIVASIDPANDLALLKLHPNNLQYQGPFPWVRITSTEETPGEPVVVMGAPLGHTSWECHGHVAREEQQLHYHRQAQWMIAVAGAINPGNSGGALIRAADGTLLGVSSMKPASALADGMGWAVHWRYVQALLEGAGIRQPE